MTVVRHGCNYGILASFFLLTGVEGQDVPPYYGVMFPAGAGFSLSVSR